MRQASDLHVVSLFSQFMAVKCDLNLGLLLHSLDVQTGSAWVSNCPDARERAGPVFPPPPHCVGEEETQTQRARARRDKPDAWGESFPLYHSMNLFVYFDFDTLCSYP